ncbi:hypothetical protein PE066_03335 [Ramlibacter tataouinensis]|uniref:hypothetical protein n=1 Tax=Ramlibacter tataouinensis TaxID=94132 RepID=UPI0022F3D11E|nr:hypothetical protein [Ramlibacter tataouinensis]WBY02583.1 hypothetical protein PE066_03335 [Ramlibacter tataouinensis]
MKCRHALLRGVPAVALALAGCGGGISIGFGFFDDNGVFDEPRSDGLHLPRGEPGLGASVLALALFDSLAGTERLMAAAGAHAQLGGPAGTAAEQPCAAGSIATRKTAPNRFVLDARRCQLVAGDPLVYDGSWIFTIQSSGYAADGRCPAGSACVLAAALDTATARFGYGTPALRATGDAWRQETGTDGVLQVQAQAAGATTFLDGVGFRPVGTTASLVADEFSLSGDSVRRTVTVTAPIRAAISTDSTRLVSAIDDDGDGIADRTLVVPWGWIVD